YDSLKKWNYHFNKDYVSPSVFDVWWYYVQKNIWDDDLKNIKGGFVLPDEAVTLNFLRDSVRFKYYDDFATPDTEDRKFVVRKAYQQAIDSLKRFSENMEDWKWMNVKNTTIRHLARQTPFNHTTVPTGGNRGILNACSRYWGPSWRMVVSLGKEIEAYGIYPGGQSGNPGSPYYDNWVGEWANGNYRKLWFMRSANDSNGKVVSRETFKKG
ncbi:MAG: penicillin acylase family protein, partial [Bacteroidia bacterium]